MLQNIRELLRFYIPNALKPKIFQRHARSENEKLINEINQWYSYHKPNSEIEDILLTLPKCGLTPFPYLWASTKNAKKVPVYHDKEKDLPYVILDGKRLYYPRDMTKHAIKSSYYFLQNIEQNILSPHRYLTDDFNVSPEDIVVDCGGAEGNFSLFVVDKVKKVYLFEPEQKWLEPLTATFSPWKDKVEIIPHYISDETNENTTTIDEYFKDKEHPTFYKLDVEGYEEKVLLGAKNQLSSPELKKLVTCTYHYADDEIKLGKILKSYNFSISHSDGYMLFYMYDDFKPPYFRRGVLRCIKT